MRFKIIILFFLASCVPKDLSKNYKKEIIFTNVFINHGFALIYDNNIKKQKVISKSIDDRSLIVFQKNLKKDTVVKITNFVLILLKSSLLIDTYRGVMRGLRNSERACFVRRHR